MIVGEIDDEQDRDEEEIIKDLDSGVLVELSENEDDPPVCEHPVYLSLFTDCPGRLV